MHQQAHPHLLGLVLQCLLVAPRYYLVTVQHSDLHPAELEHLLGRELSYGVVFEVASDDVENGGEGLAPVVDLAGADVAGAEDGVDLVGGDHFLVLGRHLCAAEGDVEVPQHQCQLPHLFLLGHVDLSDIIADPPNSLLLYELNLPKK